MKTLKNIVLTGAIILLPALGFGFSDNPEADKNEMSANAGITDPPLIYVDENGIMRNSETDEEMAWYGVNYSPPFAHSYRAMDLLGFDHKAEMDKDIYHFARLGMNGFRIHVWDTEISDHDGNLLQNEHLDLFDYKMYKLSERGINVILTPFTFYDNAYPDGATPTPGFANFISKGQAPNPEHRDILKRYLEQFLTHVNPYTGMTYLDDPNVIAVEIVNEPHHSGDLDPVREYVNDLANHIRALGTDKPVFYNISESPAVAEAVMNAEVEGVTFQWYPGGLVGGETIKRNYLPYIDEYTIPFGDEEAMQDKALMVYEFDSADLSYSYAYPAMARSFREAGFQWATQFAYDPLAISFANSDYPTHYLNMIYTPEKSISMLIASEVFQRYPLNAEPQPFPQNKTFGDFRVSHSEDLSEMNTESSFLYSNHTQTEPLDPAALNQIAGTGNSPVVQYDGTGAYFLDKLEDGIWRLEVMPDVIHVRDPFERPAFDKHVSVIEWHERNMSISIPDLGEQFSLKGLNEGNDLNSETGSRSFTVTPGAYLLVKEGRDRGSWNADSRFKNIKIGEYEAIEATSDQIQVRHEPVRNVDAAQPLTIRATVAGLAPDDTVRVIGYPYAGQGFDIVMEESSAFQYEAEIPADYLQPGYIYYWISVNGEDGQLTWPGAHEGNPYAWNYYHDDRWELLVAGHDTPVELFNAGKDYSEINYAFRTWQHRHYERSLVPAGEPGKMAVQVKTDQLHERRDEALGFSAYTADNLKGRIASAKHTNNLVINGRKLDGSSGEIKVILKLKDATSFSASLSLTDRFESHTLSLEDLERDSFMLLPRPYPGFMAFLFQSEETGDLRPEEIEDIQFLIESEGLAAEDDVKAGFEIQSVWLTN